MSINLKKIALASLGGIDVVIYLITPILLSVFWISLFGLMQWQSYVIFCIGLLSSLFRGIKIGWLRND